jgi:hypothetical protein
MPCNATKKNNKETNKYGVSKIQKEVQMRGVVTQWRSILKDGYGEIK